MRNHFYLLPYPLPYHTQDGIFVFMRKQPVESSSPTRALAQNKADAAKEKQTNNAFKRAKEKLRFGPNAIARSGRSDQGEANRGDESGMMFGEYLYGYGDEAPVQPFRSAEDEEWRMAVARKEDKVDNKLTRPKKKK